MEWRAVYREDKNSGWYVIKVIYQQIHLGNDIYSCVVTFESWGSYESKEHADYTVQQMQEMV